LAAKGAEVTKSEKSDLGLLRILRLFAAMIYPQCCRARSLVSSDSALFVGAMRRSPGSQPETLSQLSTALSTRRLTFLSAWPSVGPCRC
jgi:hypothetical protein